MLQVSHVMVDLLPLALPESKGTAATPPIPLVEAEYQMREGVESAIGNENTLVFCRIFSFARAKQINKLPIAKDDTANAGGRHVH